MNGHVPVAITTANDLGPADYFTATLNILEDSRADRLNSDAAFKASLNILSDLSDEKTQSNDVRHALLNLLDDSVEEKDLLVAMQKAALNILDDFDVERARAEQAYADLVNETSGRKAAEGALERAMLAEDGLRRAMKLAEAARLELERANEDLQSFSYTVAHDLRAPLRAIAGFSEILLSDHLARLDTDGQEILSDILANVRRMTSFIDDLLTFSRLGRAGVSLSDVDMTALVQTVARGLREEVPARAIKIAIKPLGRAWCDAAMLRHVWTNLLSNALKFTRHEAVARITIASEERSGEVVYSIFDNGVGFDMRYVGKLFGVFERLHTIVDFEGTGIGLAIVHRIVERQGGRVWAEGAVGEGARFFFTLPRGSE